MSVETFRVSADIGPVCPPWILKYMYRDKLGPIEEIGWLWSPLMIWLDQKLGHNVFRIHGRIGAVEEEVKNGNKFDFDLVHKLMLPTASVIRLAQLYRIPNILVHVTEAIQSFNVLEKLPQQMTVWLENNEDGKSGLEPTYQLASALSWRGVNVGVTVDVGHLRVERGADSDHAIRRAVTVSRELMRKHMIPKRDFHLPLSDGRERGAICLSEVSDPTLLKLFASGRVELENQVRWELMKNPLYLTTLAREIFPKLIRLSRIQKQSRQLLRKNPSFAA